jgi:hypothetical protein
MNQLIEAVLLWFAGIGWLQARERSMVVVGHFRPRSA